MCTEPFSYVFHIKHCYAESWNFVCQSCENPSSSLIPLLHNRWTLVIPFIARFQNLRCRVCKLYQKMMLLEVNARIFPILWWRYNTVGLWRMYCTKSWMSANCETCLGTVLVCCLEAPLLKVRGRKTVHSSKKLQR